jgi:peptidyl-prolyl cis-trans isomerase A (cyclophilin A)
MMTTTTRRITLGLAALLIAHIPAALADEGVTAETDEKAPTAVSKQNPALLDPSLATEHAPDAYRVKLETTKGEVTILVNRSWAPNGADRFYNLVKIGYFDDIALYRAVRGFMVQGGFNGDPDVTTVWSNTKIPDDPMTQSNTRGMVTFAQPSMPNARTTQFFINTTDNGYLKQHGSFSPFGKVISGMDVVDSFYTGYGEGAPRGKGPSQGRIAREGNLYLKASFPELDYIVSASIVEAE